MSEIPDIEIKPINIPGINSAILNHPTFTSPDVPVMVPLGFPIIEMPCVETRRSEYENDALIQNDPDGNVTLCTGSVPSFRAMDYTPEELVIQEEAQPQRFEEPETPPTAEPPSTPAKSEDCPPANAPKIGTKVPEGKGTKEITGYQLVGNRCVTQYSEVSFVEQITDAIPSVPQVVTTGSIAVIATASAAATPFLLRVVKPLVKQVITRVKRKFGAKEEILSTRERMLRQRELTRAVRELRKMKK